VLKINRIVLEDFLNIERCDLDTDARVVLITGPNGSGKSAVLEAIRTILSSKKRADKYNEYIRQGCNRATIHLEAVVNGKDTTFDVELNLKKGAAFGMTIVHDGSEYRLTEAQDLLKSFDFDYYSDIVLTMQNDQDITELSPGARSVYLQRLLNFDFEKQKQRVRSDLDDLAIKRSDLKREASTIEALMEREGKLLREEIPESRYDSEEEETERDVLQARLDSMEEGRREKTRLMELKSQLSMEAVGVEREIGSLERRIEEIDVLEKKLTRKAAERDEARVELNAEKESIGISGSKLEKVAEETATLRNILGDHESILRAHRALLDEVNRMKALSDDGICPTCGQKTDDHNDEIIGDLKIRYVRIANRPIEGWDPTSYDDILSEMTISMPHLVSEVERMTLQLKQHEKDSGDLQLSMKMSEARIGSLENKISSLAEDILVIEVPTDGSELESELEGKRKRSVEIASEVEGISDESSRFDDSDWEETVERIGELKRTISEKAVLRTEAAAIELNNVRVREEIERLKARIGEVNQSIGLIQKDTDSKEEALRIFERDLPNYMIVKTCASLQDEMNDFIHSIFPQYDVKLIQGKGGTIFNYTKDRRIDESVSNSWINAKMSSGFERCMLTMAFKQSLCKLYDLDFCVLDECDKAADDNSSDKLFEQILGDETWSQCWVISHKKGTCQSILDSQDDCRVFLARGGRISEVDSPFEGDPD